MIFVFGSLVGRIFQKTRLQRTYTQRFACASRFSFKNSSDMRLNFSHGTSTYFIVNDMVCMLGSLNFYYRMCRIGFFRFNVSLLARIRISLLLKEEIPVSTWFDYLIRKTAKDTGRS